MNRYISYIGQALAVGDIVRAQVLYGQFEQLVRTKADRWWAAHFADCIAADLARRTPPTADAG